MKVMVETSARHVHVTQETLEKLFGAGATLTKKKKSSHSLDNLQVWKELLLLALREK